ncbi:MAG: MerR family transcriptional regulator [Anaerolineae bacterium]|nr:MerR family transcriptional regulator [Anaerolineae bacterium]
MKELTIGEVAKRAGIETSAIRYYESVGLIPPPKRVNGRRRYAPTVLRRLGLIQLARGAGFRIGELQVLFTGFSEDTPASIRWQTLATEKVAEMDALIERTQLARIWLMEALKCQCTYVDDCVTLTFDESGNTTSVALICADLRIR